DGCGRAVQLHQVECVYSQVLPAAIGPRPEVLQRIRFRNMRVGAASHLRGDRDVTRFLRQILVNELLAAAIAIHVSSIEKGNSRISSRIKDAECGLRVNVTPVSS